MITIIIIVIRIVQDIIAKFQQEFVTCSRPCCRHCRALPTACSGGPQFSQLPSAWQLGQGPAAKFALRPQPAVATAAGQASHRMLNSVQQQKRVGCEASPDTYNRVDW